MHQVEINYYPDGEATQGETEILTFEKEKTAREFVARQEKVPAVLCARYLGRSR